MSTITSGELMNALAEHARTLGWQIDEWDWKDIEDDTVRYVIWVTPTEESE